MKDLDLSPLKDNDLQFEKLLVSLQGRYKCDWDDDVHDSYVEFVKDIEQYAREVRKIRCKVETLAEEADALNVEGLLEKADSLCREADAI